MENNQWSVHTAALPAEASIFGLCKSADLADAYIVRMPDDADDDPERLARHVFEQPAPWIDTLMGLRDTLVAGLGIKTASQMHGASESGPRERIGMFKIYSKSADEIVLGEDDKHLDFRISVLRQMRTISSGPAPYLIVSTVVHCHNGLGRLYLKAVGPVHRVIFPAMLRRAAGAGWPLSATPADAG
jgi:hypothetical protein